jgi:hypothetical protein
MSKYLIVILIYLCNFASLIAQSNINANIDDLINQMSPGGNNAELVLQIEKSGPTAIPVLKKYLESNDEFKSEMALRLILRIDVNSNKDLLLRFYDIDPVATNEYVLSEKVKFTEAEVQQFTIFYRQIILQSAKPSPSVSLVLAKLGDKDSIPFIKEQLYYFEDYLNAKTNTTESLIIRVESARRQIEVALGQLGDDETIKKIVTSFNDSTTTLSKVITLNQLAQIADPRTLCYVTHFLDDTKAYIDNQRFYGIPQDLITRWVVENEMPHLKPTTKDESIQLYSSKEVHQHVKQWLDDKLSYYENIAILNNQNK